MPLKDKKKRKKYIRNYMRGRYREDEEFRERMKRHNKNYREKNPDKIKERDKRWREKNPDYHKNYSREYRKAKKMQLFTLVES